jgi:glycosyltransferase involved in cell wall biosynthesis
MACGCPVVASDIPPFREITARATLLFPPDEVARGGGCLIVDQTSEDALAGGIKNLLTDQQTYSRLCTEARARKFRSWSDYIEKLLEHLQVPPGSASVPAVFEV